VEALIQDLPIEVIRFAGDGDAVGAIRGETRPGAAGPVPAAATASAGAGRRRESPVRWERAARRATSATPALFPNLRVRLARARSNPWPPANSFGDLGRARRQAHVTRFDPSHARKRTPRTRHTTSRRLLRNRGLSGCHHPPTRSISIETVVASIVLTTPLSGSMRNPVFCFLTLVTIVAAPVPAKAKTLIDYFQPTPIVCPLMSNTWVAAPYFLEIPAMDSRTRRTPNGNIGMDRVHRSDR
jgi:hypothetical protein